MSFTGSIDRFRIVSNLADGTASMAFASSMLPSPTGTVSAMGGETWRLQASYRDFNEGVTSNFTNAVAIPFL